VWHDGGQDSLRSEEDGWAGAENRHENHLLLRGGYVFALIVPGVVMLPSISSVEADSLYLSGVRHLGGKAPVCNWTFVAGKPNFLEDGTGFDCCGCDAA